MAIKLGSTDINSVNLGSVGLNRIYSGSDFVFGAGDLQSLYSYRMTTSSYVRMNNYSAFDYTAGSEFSCAVLVKFSSLTGGFQVLLSATDTSFLNGWFFGVNFDLSLVTFQYRGATIQARQQFNKVLDVSSMSTDSWYLFSFSATTLNDYTTWDFKVNASTDLLGANTVFGGGYAGGQSGKDLVIGAGSDGTIFFAEAEINAAWIFNKKLSPPETISFYNSGKPDLKYLEENQTFRARFDDDVWDAANSRFNVINDLNATGGITVNLAEADKVISSPY